MPKQQSSLDSFFACGTKVKKQKTMTSYFNKENSSKIHDDDVANVKIEQDVVGAEPRKKAEVASKHRAIVDDESRDDEADVPTKDFADIFKSSDSPVAAKKDEPPSDQIPAAVATRPYSAATSIEKKPSPTVSPSPHTDGTDKDEDSVDLAEEAVQPKSSPFLRKLQAQANKLVKQAKVSTIDQLATLASPVLYQDLVKTFEQIEAITSRLEIQGLMTTFFRRLLRDSPKDLYHCVYLASNSIAPAYDCVELGIGDSILMKAIGEAYGLKASTYRRLVSSRNRHFYVYEMELTILQRLLLLSLSLLLQAVSRKNTKRKATSEAWP